MYLFPATAMVECYSNVFAYDGVFAGFGAFTLPVEAVSWVNGLHVDVVVEGVMILHDEDVQEWH